MRPTKEKLVFKNNMQVFLWGFMGVWMAFLCIFSYLFWREGGFNQFDPLVETSILAFFWVIGVSISAHVLAQPRVRVEVQGREVLVRRLWLTRREEERFAASSAAAPKLVEGKDDEGDPYFKSVLKTPKGNEIVVKESHHKPTVEATHIRLMQAMGKEEEG